MRSGTVMAEPFTSAQFLRFTILFAIREGCHWVAFRPINEWSCEMFAGVGADAWELVPPSLEDLQALPRELVRLEAPAARLWHQLTGWLWPIRCGRRSGGFCYPVGCGSVLVGYRVQWQTGTVAELEITIGRVAELRETAAIALQELFGPDPNEVLG